MRRDTPRPASVTLTFNGIPAYRVELGPCWRALLDQRGGERMASFGALAAKAGVGRSTVSEFFLGRRRKSIDVGHRIVAALGVDFDEVASPIEPEPLRAAG